MASSDNYDNSSVVAHAAPAFYQPRETLFPTSEFERRRITRLLLESLEMAFHLCNLYLERYGVGKLFDIMNQIIPTAFIVNTGYWAFYSCKSGPSLCVCSRFGIHCPHVRNEHHWVNIDAFHESEQNCIFMSQAGPFCPSNCDVDVRPVMNEFVTAYDICIRMTVQDNHTASLDDQTTTLVIEARYAMTPECRPTEKKFVQFTPHPLSHPYYARYFDILHDYCETYATQDQFSRGFTIALSGFPKFIRSVNDDVGLPVPKLPHFYPNRPPVDPSALNELSDKFSAILHYADRDRPVQPIFNTSSMPVQNIFMMTNTVKFAQPPYKHMNGSNGGNIVVNPRPDQMLHERQEGQNGVKRRIYTSDQSNGAGAGASGYQQPAPPVANNYKRSNKRGGRRGRARQANNQLQEIAPAPPSLPSPFLGSNTNVPFYNSPPYPYQQYQPSQYSPQFVPYLPFLQFPPSPYQNPYPPYSSVPYSRFAGMPWETDFNPQRTVAPYWQELSTYNYQNVPPAKPEFHQYQNRFSVKQEPYEVTIKQERQNTFIQQNVRELRTTKPDVFGVNYNNEFPALTTSQSSKKISSLINGVHSTTSGILNEASKSSLTGKLSPSAHNPSLDENTNDLLNDIAEVIQEDLAKDITKKGKFAGFKYGRSVFIKSDLPDELEQSSPNRNIPLATGFDNACSAYIGSEPSIHIKLEPTQCDTSDTLIIVSSDED